MVYLITTFDHTKLLSRRISQRSKRDWNQRYCITQLAFWSINHIDFLLAEQVNIYPTSVVHPSVIKLPNLVTTTPLKSLDGWGWKFLKIFLKVSSCESGKNFKLHNQYAALGPSPLVLSISHLSYYQNKAIITTYCC